MPIKKVKRKNNKYNVSVEEAYKILTSKEKKYWMCNFKAVDPRTTGTRKPKNTKPPKWFSDFEKKNDERWTRQEQFNKLLMARIDNLVAKNNLKE